MQEALLYKKRLIQEFIGWLRAKGKPEVTNKINKCLKDPRKNVTISSIELQTYEQYFRNFLKNRGYNLD